jgi:hypothetical protein
MFKEDTQLSEANINGLCPLLQNRKWPQVFSETNVFKKYEFITPSSVTILVLPTLWLGKIPSTHQIYNEVFLSRSKIKFLKPKLKLINSSTPCIERSTIIST